MTFSDTASVTNSAILSDKNLNLLSGIDSDILLDIDSDILSDVHSDITSDINSNLLSDNEPQKKKHRPPDHPPPPKSPKCPWWPSPWLCVPVASPWISSPSCHDSPRGSPLPGGARWNVRATKTSGEAKKLRKPWGPKSRSLKK